MTYWRTYKRQSPAYEYLCRVGVSADHQGFSDVIDTVRTEISNTVTTIQSYVRQNRYGKAKYYEDAAKAFQYGDNLEFDENYQPYYPTIDTTKQIVKQASADISTSTVEIGVRIIRFLPCR